MPFIEFRSTNFGFPPKNTLRPWWGLGWLTGVPVSPTLAYLELGKLGVWAGSLGGAG